MTTLRNLLVSIEFDQSGNITNAILTRYLDRDGYRSTVSGRLSDLAPEIQQAFGAVVGHAQQLRAADERIATVFGEMLAPVPDQTHTETDQITSPESGETTNVERTVVDVWRPCINLALTMRKIQGVGERTMSITTEELPAPARAAVLQLWSLLTA